MDGIVQQSAFSFWLLGVEKGNHVTILRMNLSMCLMADYGFQAAGGVSSLHRSDANEQLAWSISDVVQADGRDGNVGGRSGQNDKQQQRWK